MPDSTVVAAASAGMTSLIEDVGAWVTAAAGYMSTFASTVASTPVLTLTVIAVPLVGVGVGLFKRAIRS